MAKLIAGSTVGGKEIADKEYVDSQVTTNFNILNTTVTSHSAKLDSIQEGAEVNQNAFSNVKVGTTTISADSKTDTLELVAGANISLTPDATNDKVTISANVPVSSVNGKTGAVTLTANDVGAETPGGAQAKANTAETNAKAYTDSSPEAMQRNLGMFNVYKSGKDANGIFTIVEYKRANGTLYARSVLSGGTSPKYTTRTITYYDTNGTTVIRTDPYTLVYDADGDLISEVKQ